MSALNSHIETAFYQMPGAVNKNLPPGAWPARAEQAGPRYGVRRRTRDRDGLPGTGSGGHCHRSPGSDRARCPGDHSAGRPTAPGRRIRARVRDHAGRADADRAGQRGARRPGTRRSRTRRPRCGRRLPGPGRACPRRARPGRDPPAGNPDRFRRRPRAEPRSGTNPPGETPPGETGVGGEPAPGEGGAGLPRNVFRTLGSLEEPGGPGAAGEVSPVKPA